MFCTWCGSKTHTQSTCPKLAARQGTTYRYCTFCGGKDHSVENCPKTWGGVTARELKKKKEEGKFDGIDLHY